MQDGGGGQGLKTIYTGPGSLIPHAVHTSIDSQSHVKQLSPTLPIHCRRIAGETQRVRSTSLALSLRIEGESTRKVRDTLTPPSLKISVHYHTGCALAQLDPEEFIKRFTNHTCAAQRSLATKMDTHSEFMRMKTRPFYTLPLVSHTVIPRRRGTVIPAPIVTEA